MKNPRERLFAVIVGCVAFVLVGVSKLKGPSAVRWNERFVHWGYPASVRYVVGVLEILGGLGILIPKARRGAAATLIALMIGAVFTHLIKDEVLRLIPPLIRRSKRPRGGGVTCAIFGGRALRPPAAPADPSRSCCFGTCC